jgi:hypothetical protein
LVGVTLGSALAAADGEVAADDALPVHALTNATATRTTRAASPRGGRERGDDTKDLRLTGWLSDADEPAL